MNNIIDLRSDTVTLPSENMRKVMLNCNIGDDAYGEDSNINQLQNYCKKLFAVEDALFTTSGMLSNRLAILAQTNPGDEIITESGYHINFFDSGANAAICSVVMNSISTKDGILKKKDIIKAINQKPRYHIFAQVRLIALENTINNKQGKIFPMEEIKKIRKLAEERNISLHLDGARIFNAHITSGISLEDYAREVDTLSFCFSKGLGAPFGSMLLGNKNVIDKARRHKVFLGSGFHQIGIYAAAAHYALKNNINRLLEDHRLTKLLATKLSLIEKLKIDVNDVETNMIFINTKHIKCTAEKFISLCNTKGLKLFLWLPNIVRMVIHQNITEQQIVITAQIVEMVVSQLSKHK